MGLRDRLSMSIEVARRRPAGWLAGLFLFGVVHAAGAAGPEIRVEPSTVRFGAAPAAATAEAAVAGRASQASPASSPAVWRSLREKAQAQGRIRVIVRLNTAFSPEGGLASPAAVQRQRDRIHAAQEAALRRLEGRPSRLRARFKYVPFLALEVDAATLDRLGSFPEVAGIEEDVLDKPSLASSNAVIGSGAALSLGLTGSGQTIAVLDTGVDKTHPFFAGGKVVSEACYSSTTEYTASLCPGGVSESTDPGSGVNCPADVYGCDHGTHVAGIAAGHPGTGLDFGVARDAGIIAIQVFSEDEYFGDIGAFVSDQIKGLERVFELAEDFDIAAVNMSLGGGFYSSRASCDAGNAARKAAIDNLRSIDVATVAASGNSGSTGFLSAPACISSAISVGATNDADQIAYFSNIAAFLDLVAPGVDVDSSVPGGGTASFDGTSMAAPHVAGAWAVLKAAHPGATVADILAILRNSAVRVSGGGFGDLRRINLGKAVLTGPYVSRSFTISNDGTEVLSILSMELEQPVSWIGWMPEAPFDILPGGSRQVTVSVDFSRAPDGESVHRLLVGSTDGDESPYPDGVYLVVDKQPCHLLSRSRTGSGGNPEPVPSSSPGCPAGQYHAGTTVQLLARPATGWDLESWSGTADDASTALTNEVTVPEGGHSVSVTYFARCYTLTRTHTGSGSDPAASPANSPGCPAGQHHYAEPVTLTAAPAAGWRLGSWTGTAQDASTKTTNSLVMPASDHEVAVSYLEGLPLVLLVDDDEEDYLYPRQVYTSALDALGVIYDIWDTQTDGEPDAATLAGYPRVVWYTGYFGSGPGAAGEASLASYLQGGGTLLLSSEGYLYQGVSTFARDYLGVQSASAYSEYRYTISGQGPAFGGLGPFDFYDYAFPIQPGPGAEAAFLGSGFSTSAVVGVSKVGPAYRTVFLGFSLEELDYGEGVKSILSSSLGFLGTIFNDVPPNYWAKRWIEAVYHAGITSGCTLSPRNYCPDVAVTRDQMALFLLRAKEGAAYAPSPCITAPFSDVPVSNPLCPWIQELVRRGVTSGCGGDRYCPEAQVTRSQMAVFLLATVEGPGYTPAPCAPSPFSDISAASPFCPWIQELARRGITGGCGSGTFCPELSNTRAQLAVFLVTAFGLPLP